MNNSYFWSADDAKAGRCSFGSIGIERRYDPPDQLGDVWADDDAAAGRCLASEVGRPRRAPFDTFTDPADEPDIEPDTEDALPAELLDAGMFEREMYKYRNDAEAYKASNPPALLVKLLATDEERRQRALAASGDDRRILAEIALKKFRQLPIVKRYMGILAPVMVEADDVRDRILAAWGLTPEIIEQMHAEMLTSLEED